jgi:hypothetical protein
MKMTVVLEMEEMKCGLIEMNYITIKNESIQHPIKILHFQFIIQCKQHSWNEVVMLVNYERSS